MPHYPPEGHQAVQHDFVVRGRITGVFDYLALTKVVARPTLHFQGKILLGRVVARLQSGVS